MMLHLMFFMSNDLKYMMLTCIIHVVRVLQGRGINDAAVFAYSKSLITKLCGAMTAPKVKNIKFEKWIFHNND